MTLRTSILIVCGIALLLPMVAGPSTAAEPEMWLWGPGGNPADIEREVLWLDNDDWVEEEENGDVDEEPEQEEDDWHRGWVDDEEEEE